MLYFHVMCTLRNWFTSVLLCIYTEASSRVNEVQFCVKSSNAVLYLHRSFLSWFQIQFSCVFLSVKWNFQNHTTAVSLWKSCCNPFAFPSSMSSLAPVYCEHIGGHRLSWKGAHCRCWVRSLAGELRGWHGSRQLTEATTITYTS